MNRPFVINVNRKFVKDFDNSISTEDLVWISISEPESEFTKNDILDKLPNIKLKFWDVTHEVSDLENPEIKYLPPTEDDAMFIVDFISKYPNRNILVNCAAGISRSGAVARFCEECLNYEWIEEGKKRSHPNFLLFSMMRKYHEKLEK